MHWPRFAPHIDVTTHDAQLAIVKGLNATIPAVLRVGDTTVYQAQSSTLQVMTWFHGQYLFVLAIRDLVGKSVAFGARGSGLPTDPGSLVALQETWRGVPK